MRDGDEAEEGLTRDTVFSTLSNQRRRHALHYLKRTTDPVTIRDLAEQLAAWENDIGIEEISYKQRKRVYTSLHQTHLPKLDDVGVVEYDRNRGTILLTDRAAELDVYLELVPEEEEEEDPWSDYYLGIAAVGGALVAAGWLDVGPFGLLPDIAYAALLVLALGVTASLHAVRSRQSLGGGTDTPADAGPLRPPGSRFGDGSGEESD